MPHKKDHDKEKPEDEIVPEIDDLQFEDEEEAEDPKSAIKKLKERLRQSQKERQEFLETSQRLKADYINSRRDEAQAREHAIKYAKLDLLHELIDLADSFEMAMANREAWEAVPENWRKGVEYIYGKLKNIFDNHGMSEINPINKPFNPEEAHSVATIDTDRDDQDNIVLEVVQKGYKLHDRVVRPARVKVGHKK